jgi:hypothetical protein
MSYTACTQSESHPSFYSMKITYDNKQTGIIVDSTITGIDSTSNKTTIWTPDPLETHKNIMWKLDCESKNKYVVWTPESFTKVVSDTLNTLNTSPSTCDQTSVIVNINDDISYISKYGYNIISCKSISQIDKNNVHITIEFSYNTQWGTISVEIMR